MSALLKTVEAIVNATRVTERNPGDHYANKRNAARIYIAALDVVRDDPEVERATVLALEDRLTLARYTGD